jgi:single-strand DNA-binding protein
MKRFHPLHTGDNIMAKDIPVTVTGWVASNPTISRKDSAFTRFRMGSTPRYYDLRNKAWMDGRTEWFTVNIFRGDMAENAAESIRRGDPLLVSGRLRTSEWQKDTGETMTSMEIVADAVGHNMNYGSSRFSRTTRPEAEDQSSDKEWEKVSEEAEELDDGELGEDVPVN